MTTTLPRYVKYLSLFVVLIAILYKYEIPLDPSSPETKTLIFTKVAAVQHDRTHVYKVITNIDKYASVGKLCPLANH